MGPEIVSTLIRRFVFLASRGSNVGQALLLRGMAPRRLLRTIRPLGPMSGRLSGHDALFSGQFPLASIQESTDVML